MHSDVGCCPLAMQCAILLDWQRTAGPVLHLAIAFIVCLTILCLDHSGPSFGPANVFDRTEDA